MSKHAQFGKHLRSEFLIEPEFTPLNHGSYGALPKALLPIIQEFRMKAEASPDRWLKREVFPLIDRNKAAIAELIHADPNELVFVFNAMTGINTVARSLPLKAGDKVLYFNTAYNAVESTIQFINDFESLKLVKIDLAYPLSDHAILEQIKETIEYENSLQNGSIKVCFMDAITSVPGLLFPFEAVVKLVREYSILSLVDGAHAIGQIPLDLHAVDPDFFITNCHKWLYAPRGCAVLYVPLRNQHLVHPAIINASYQHHPQPGTNTFQLEFAWPGTTDFTNFLCVEAALAFRKSIGGEKAIMDYCHDLAVSGGQLAATILGTEVLENEEKTLTTALVNVRLPINPAKIQSDPTFIQLSVDELIYKHHCMASVFKHNGQWYARLSAQVYNDLSDFEYVAKALLDLCHQQ
ncbi:hypothetical protein A0J61_07158 [Choanephora cucurbitarum]|uniref:Aminotransferase class V domain-containing protein n=1 Tax=Choanephora cucurbitarum TaxID=101091 RepID=A0A1C7N6Q2_9FUNG|nr:hypothetical protein A0J61_07158 [Choanephora cucurbitarum]